MFKKVTIRNSMLAGFFIMTILLTACGGGQEANITCEASSLQLAANLSPQDIVVDSSKPVTLSWTYSDNNCQPTYYEITLGKAHDGSAAGMTQTSQTTSLSWPETLQPGNTYFWTVSAMIISNGQASRGPGQMGTFYTGPTCTAETVLTAPQTITPPNNIPFDPTTIITLRWDDPTTCLPDGSYSVQIAKTADFSSVLYANQTGHITELILSPGWTDDVVQDCTQYFWRVRSESSTGSTGPWSGTGSFIINNVGSTCNLLQASATPLPAATATATLLPQTAATAPAWLQANENVHCRRGPGPEYPSLDILTRQWSARIYGRNEESTWWYINSPNIAVGYYCWVWGGSVTLSGDTSRVPVVIPEPPPTWTAPPPTETPPQ